MFAPGLYGLPLVDETIKPRGPIRVNRQHPLFPDRVCVLLNEGGGEVVRDYARDNRMGELFNGQNEATTWQIAGGELCVDLGNIKAGSDQSATVRLAPIGVLSAGSAMVRLNPDDVGSDSRNALAFTHSDFSGGARMYLGQSTSASQWAYRLGSSSYGNVSSPAPVVGQWDTIALTWSGGNSRFFVNGVNAHNSTYSGTPGSTADQTQIGYKGETTPSGDDFNFNGKVSFAYAWGRQLTDAQIWEISQRPYQLFNYDLPVWAVEAAAPAGGWPMGSLAAGGGLVGHGGLAGRGGGLAG